MSKLVKAGVTTAPGKMEIREYPYPKLEEGCAIVKMGMAGICGLDKHVYKGEDVLYAGTDRERRAQYPVIPGHENVGTIVEISSEGKTSLELYGKELCVGDRVIIGPNTRSKTSYDATHGYGLGWDKDFQTYGVTISCENPPHILGGFSEYLYVKKGTSLVKIPDGIPFDTAVLVENIVCAYAADKGREFYSMPTEGFAWMDPVVVLGVGPQGILNVMKCRLYGAGIIIALDLSDYRLEMAKEFGADYVINVSNTTKEERLEMIKELTGGLGPQIVIDCVGEPDVFLEGIEMVRNGGMFFEGGAYVETGSITISPHRHILAKNIRIIGIAEIAYVDFDRGLHLLDKYGDVFPFHKMVTHRFSIEQSEEAILKSMDLDSMKVVVCPDL